MAAFRPRSWPSIWHLGGMTGIMQSFKTTLGEPSFLSSIINILCSRHTIQCYFFLIWQRHAFFTIIFILFFFFNDRTGTQRPHCKQHFTSAAVRKLSLTEYLANVGVVHVWASFKDLPPLFPCPHHEGIHGPLDMRLFHLRRFWYTCSWATATRRLVGSHDFCTKHFTCKRQ